MMTFSPGSLKHTRLASRDICRTNLEALVSDASFLCPFSSWVRDLQAALGGKQAQRLLNSEGYRHAGACATAGHGDGKCIGSRCGSASTTATSASSPAAASAATRKRGGQKG